MAIVISILALCGAGFVVFKKNAEAEQARLQNQLEHSQSRADTLKSTVDDISPKVKSLKTRAEEAEELEKENSRLRKELNKERTTTETTQTRTEEEEEKEEEEVSETPSSSSPNPSPTPEPNRVRGHGEKMVLTFDDGGAPNKVTAILNILNNKNVQAVMFLNGRWAHAHPDLVRRMRAEGHIVANHTWSHAKLTELPDEEVRREIRRGAQEGSDLFRPPYGAIDARVRGIVQSMGLRTMLWDIDTRDWDNTSADEITRITLNNARPGAVVLLHLHGEHTAEALPRMIDGLRNQGYTFGLPAPEKEESNAT